MSKLKSRLQAPKAKQWPPAACAGCKNYLVIKRPDGTDEASGICRRYPPEVVLIAAELRSVFPQVRADMWCGEFKSPDRA